MLERVKLREVYEMTDIIKHHALVGAGKSEKALTVCGNVWFVVSGPQIKRLLVTL